jgi:hypothetical protein
MEKLAKCEVMEMSSKMQGDGDNLQNTRQLAQIVQHIQLLIFFLKPT